MHQDQLGPLPGWVFAAQYSRQEIELQLCHLHNVDDRARQMACVLSQAAAAQLLARAWFMAAISLLRSCRTYMSLVVRSLA